MNYLEYLKQPHYLAIACAVVSVIVAFAESKYSKVKNDKKYYVKIFLISFLNVFIVVHLIKRDVIKLEGISKQSGGNITNSLTEALESSIKPSNYEAVDIGSPSF